MRRQATPLRSVTTVLLVSGVAGGLAACGGGSGGGSSPPPMPVASGEALDAAITADPPSTAPDLLNADGSGTPAENSMLEEAADAARAKIGGWADTVYERTNESDSGLVFHDAPCCVCVVIPGDLVIVPSPSELSPRRFISSATGSDVRPELE